MMDCLSLDITKTQMEKLKALFPEAVRDGTVVLARPEMAKDRVGRTLSFEDIAHYQKIIVALLETERLMGEVDGVM
jgi:hypothetical protein